MVANSLKYLEEYKSLATVGVYKSCLKRFLRSIYGDEELKAHDLELADKYVGEVRDAERDIKDFFISLKDAPPKTARAPEVILIN